MVKNNAKLRLLYVQPSEGFGGAERQSVVMARYLPFEDIEVIPFIGPGEPIARALKDAGITNFEYCKDLPSAMEGPGSIFRKLHRFVRLIVAWKRTSRRITQVVREYKIDIVLAARAFGWTVVSRNTLPNHVRILWRAGSRPTTWIHRKLLYILGKIQRPDALICNCKSVERLISPCLNCESFIVPNGVDVEEFNPQSAYPHFRHEHSFQDCPIVGMAARPAPEKGFDILIQIIDIIRAEIPRVRILIAGDHAWKDTYKKVFSRHGLTEEVVFLGHIDNMADFYASCDVIVLTSREKSIEGSPNTVLEAMAMARSIVAADVGGIHEIISHGENGFLAAPEKPSAFAYYLVHLLKTPLRQKEMGNAGKKTVETLYSHQKSAERLANVCRLTFTQTRRDEERHANDSE